MKKGFTLLELLIVVGIMSMLGTISVNGYRALVRGMEERGAISSASAFLRAARQRAQIDNKPICIFTWNEMLKAETDDEPAIIVGKAIAVQQTGRFSGVDGDMLVDEFGDLNLGFEVADDPDNRLTMRIYNLSPDADCKYAIVSTQVTEDNCEDADSCFMKSSKEDRVFNTASGDKSSSSSGIVVYAFKKVGGEASFKAGDAYGSEFASLTLPHGYLFGSSMPSSMSSPISGEDKKFYKRPQSSDMGVFDFEIYSLRPEKGRISAKSIGKAKDTY